MISKKSFQADLESKRGLFFEIGLILSLVAVFIAFQIRTPDRNQVNRFNFNELTTIEEEMLNTLQTEPPKPPQQPVNQQTTVLTIVENDALDAQDIEIQVEIDQKTIIPDYIPPAMKEKEEEEIIEPQIFIIVEEQPEFPGGDAARIEYFARSVHYPQSAREFGIQGTVYVSFVVEPDGSISNVKILRGIGGGCDEEALRVVSAMPSWKPGKQRNKAVRVQFTLPVRFKLL